MELKHALLGLLSIRPMSGYDLGKAFTSTAAHFWHADLSQIYRTLDRLASQGLITTREIPQRGKPDRKVHSLTDAGRTDLERWLRTPLESERTKSPLLARLFFAAPLGAHGALAVLAQREEQVRAQLSELESLESGSDTLADALRTATLDYGLTAARTELDWIARTRTILEGHRQ